MLPRDVSVKSRPRLSVVIPAYNEAAFIGECLQSLSDQDFAGPYEVIVVDNNSTDETAEIARAHGATVVREENAGVCWARQRGTVIAEGEVIISTDADTTFDPGWLSRIDRAFREDSSVVAVAGPCRFVDAPVWGRMYTGTLFGLVRMINRVSGKVLYVTATNIAFRKNVWPGYDTRATQGGDELGLLRQLRAHGKVTFDRGNPTFTSSRRLYRGFAYNVFVTFFFYYLLGYGINRLTGRPLVGMAPAFRAGARPGTTRRKVERLVIASLCLALFLIVGGLTAHIVDQR